MLAQSPSIIPDSGPCNHLSPVQEAVAHSPYHYILSPGLQASGTPYLGDQSIDQAFTINSLDLNYPSQTHLAFSEGLSLTSIDLSHQWSSSNSPRHSGRSPPHCGTFTSPFPPLAETTVSLLSGHPSYNALNDSTDASVHLTSNDTGPDLSNFDWFEAYISYRSRSSSCISFEGPIAEVVRSFIKPVHNYQDQRELEIFESKWSIIRDFLPVNPEHETDGSTDSEAIGALKTFVKFRDYHHQHLPCDIDPSFAMSKTLQALLPFLDRNDEDQWFAICAALILASEGRVQDAERVLLLVFQEIERQSDWDPKMRRFISLISAWGGRPDKAITVLENVFEKDFPITITMADGKNVLLCEYRLCRFRQTPLIEPFFCSISQPSPYSFRRFNSLYKHIYQGINHSYYVIFP